MVTDASRTQERALIGTVIANAVGRSVLRTTSSKPSIAEGGVQQDLGTSIASELGSFPMRLWNMIHILPNG